VYEFWCKHLLFAVSLISDCKRKTDALLRYQWSLASVGQDTEQNFRIRILISLSLDRYFQFSGGKLFDNAPVFSLCLQPVKCRHLVKQPLAIGNKLAESNLDSSGIVALTVCSHMAGDAP